MLEFESTVMTTVELDTRTVEQLHALASASGMSVDAYLRRLLHASTDRVLQRLSEFEMEALLRELAFDGPTLPADFSRADIYGEHG